MQINHTTPTTLNSRFTLRGCIRPFIKNSTLIFFILATFYMPAHAIGPYSATSSTIIDLGTGLEWQKSGNPQLNTWKNALNYCENLALNSKNDWRLPNIRELKSLVDYSRYFPAIDPALPCQSSIYWSSTSVANDAPISAWSVFFGNGDDVWKLKTNRYHIRCVRAGLVNQ